MPAREDFQYAILRVIPRVERGESLNAGVVLFSRRHGFLAARTELDAAALAALSPGGDPAAGPIARLDTTERFHWLTAPSSTIVQASPVHTGLTADPAAELDHLFATLVKR